MADATTVLGIPFPEGSDTFSAQIVEDLAARVDEAPGIESLTSAEISGLAAGEKPAGRVVYNSTTSKLQVSNGTNFADVDAAALASAALKLPLAGGTMSGAIAMGGSKVTGLAAATANGDAVRYEQLTPKLDSAQVVGGVWAGTTDASGDGVIALPSSPTGNWAVTLTAKHDSYSWSTVQIVNVTNVACQFRLFKWGVTTPIAATSESVCDVHYTAIAY